MVGWARIDGGDGLTYIDVIDIDEAQQTASGDRMVVLVDGEKWMHMAVK